jgi:hypothetical protein
MYMKKQITFDVYVLTISLCPAACKYFKKNVLKKTDGCCRMSTAPTQIPCKYKVQKVISKMMAPNRF